jgi:membrane fusion protein (multidrug efflux system)
MWVKEGTPLMSVVPMDQIWVNANFKETQMRRMRIGQRAKIKVDLYGKKTTFHGKIVGLPAVAGNVTSLLPPQNLSGNWIKIVQRLPVRIELDPDELKSHPLRLGLSSEVTIDLTNESGPYLPASSKGSPTYQTKIYEKEEAGDKAYIQKVIAANLDPHLSKYRSAPLKLPPISLSIPKLIEQALSLNPSELFKPPLPKDFVQESIE